MVVPGSVVVERFGAGLAILTLDRPDQLNTLTRELRRELRQVVQALEADPQVRVLLLTGRGRAFCAGLDLAEWGAEDGAAAAGAYVEDAVAALRVFSGPVIGAINGSAITGGLELALACDFLVASTQASFADTHAQVGLLPGWGGSVRLARRVGLARAKELALTGRTIDSAEALDWGLVNHVVPPPRLLPVAQDLAAQMLQAEPTTLRAYRRLLDEGADLPASQALEAERRISIAHNTPVTRASVQARVNVMRAARHATDSKDLA